MLDNAGSTMSIDLVALLAKFRDIEDVERACIF